MKVYMTNGTLLFLKKLAEKHQQIPFHFMQNESSTLAYYEGIKKNIFAAGREFNTVYSYGELAENGFVMMDHIPVASDAQPVFENSFPEVKANMIKARGFQAMRLLKPRRGNIYIIFSQWDHKTNYTIWDEQTQDIRVKSPAYFADKRFKASYFMVEEDDDEKQS